MCVSEDRNRKRSSQTETKERERGEPHYHAAEKTLVNAVLRSAKQAPANVRQLNNIPDVIFYCSVGERSWALALLNAALVFYSTLNLVFMKGRLLVKRLSNHDQLQTAFLRLKYMML